jgi:hypothetical protein
MWSNRELAKFGGLFVGHVVNVSAWKDEDKEGRRYKDYFPSSSSYSITNYSTDKKGMHAGLENQIFLNLEKEIDTELKGKFDVVFNHTVLEHIFECGIAFQNLCDMSKDIVIVVVPFLQHQHAAYGDYWRFTPEGVSRLFQKAGLELLYINYNDGSNQFVYIFAIGARNGRKWTVIRDDPDNQIKRLTGKVGYQLVDNGLLFRLKAFLLSACLRIGSFAMTMLARSKNSSAPIE